MSKQKRIFNDYPVEPVIETARMLYALHPFASDDKSEIKWNSLAQQAFDFLDNLHNAVTEIARRRSATDAAYRRAEKRSADAEKLPDVVPFDKAIRVITSQSHTQRAELKFKALVLGIAKTPTTKELRAQVKQWRKEGMPRGEVMELQAHHDNAVRITREKREAKHKQAKKQKRKRRGPRLDEKDKPVIHELLRAI